MILTHFDEIMGRPPQRITDLNWDSLGITQHDLRGLDVPFTEDELKNVINQMPFDKAPGPDGFIGAFIKSCWDIIKDDIIAAANSFYSLRCRSLQIINSANIVLLPKKEGADAITEFRPISLIHSFVKILTKALALRLAPYMNSIVSTNQSAFIKKRSIHDNFLSVRNTARRFHKNRTPTLFFKLDIAKAFDSVRWDYLLTLMQRLGFPDRWREMIAQLLSTSCSRVLLNGIPTRPILHGRGLRQGDPLSPLLFVIAIDPLQKLLNLATEKGIFSKIRGRTPGIRISLYADAAALFLAPIKEEVSALAELLTLFGEATGLKTNFQKSTVVPIRCNGLNITPILVDLPAKRTQFPIKYLGLPLTTIRLRRVDFQPLVDKTVAKLNSWNGRNLNYAGRLTLVKSVLTSQVVYFLTALRAPKATLQDIDAKRKQFLWAGTEKITGAKCKVNWTQAARSKKNGGLGILHLGKFTRALRAQVAVASLESRGQTLDRQ